MRFNTKATVLLLSIVSCKAIVVPELAFLPPALDAVEEGLEEHIVLSDHMNLLLHEDVWGSIISSVLLPPSLKTLTVRSRIARVQLQVSCGPLVLPAHVRELHSILPHQNSVERVAISYKSS